MARARSVFLFVILSVIAGLLESPSVVAAPVSAQAQPVRPQAQCVTPAAAQQQAAASSAPEPRRLPVQGAAAVSDTYSALLTPQRMIPGEEVTVAVTVSNKTSRVWPKSDFVLSYHWKLADGTDYTSPANRRETALPADLQPGQSVTVDATVASPIGADLGKQRESFVLDWDMLDRRAGKWLSETDQVPPLSQEVTAEFATSDQLGLEGFYQYGGVNAGAGWTAMVNQFSGNAVVGYNALSNPSRGLSTFVRLTYNSLDGSNSYLGRGWSLTTSSVARLGSPLGFHQGLFDHPDYPSTISLIDGDGTSHWFKLNKHDSSDTAKWTYDSPAGVHLYLQRTGSDDKNRTWVMTQPDRTRVFFDADGYQTVLADKNGNELTLHYQYTQWGNRNTGVLTEITDATGRRTLTLDYNDHDQLRSIVDVTGRTITFTYDDSGQPSEIVDGAGTAAQKVFGFFYSGGKLARINDTVGHGTQLRYSDDGRLHELVDRRDKTMSVDYADADGSAGSGIWSRANDANGHPTTVVMDGYGRPVKVTNARGEVTELAWDDDNNVRLLKENNGAVSTWVYDRKTGYPLEIKDAEANARNTASTVLGYRTGPDGYTADLTGKTSPEGRKWTFGYDDRGNLTSVTDPKNFTSSYTYDEFGQPLTTTDANGHATTYGDYDLTGYPRRTVDALGCTTTVGYDVVGNVVSVTDARGKTSTFTYDIFSRPLDSRVPKDAAVGQYIVTPGPRYDSNDNVLSSTAPNGAVTSAYYDAADQLVAVVAPKDDPTDPDKMTTYNYDAVGNLVKQTEPKGMLTTNSDTDFVTTYTYDELNRQVSSVDADGNRASYTYDSVGNLVTVVDPRKNASPDPGDVTARYTYDLNHRVTQATDAAGFSTSQEYDRDNNVIATADREGNKTLLSLDERAAVTEVRVPRQRAGDAIIYRTTQFVYDPVGNRTKTITPRGVETGDDPDDFVQEVVYDALNRVVEQRTPFDRDDERVTAPDSTFYSYDEVGNLTEVSAPPSAGQNVRNVTRNTYFDNGWVRSGTDPWNIVTTYDYDVLGNQASRTLTAAGGSATRTMGWEYYPDGKLKSRTDDGVPVGKDVLLVDNSDAAALAVGNWATAGPGDDHEGYDYRTHDAGTGADTFTWNLDVPRNGTYEVFVRYPSVATATDASYTIEFDGGVETKTVDQTQQAGEWISLGSHGYTEDQIRRITLSDNADGTVAADAVKLVRDGSGEVDNEQKTFGYVYDPNDNLVEMTDSSPEATVDEYLIGYTGLNQISQVQEKLDGVVKNTTGYTYDPNGNPLTRTHDAQNAAYEYDARDLVSKVTNTDTTPNATPQVTSFTYTPRAQPLRETKANGNTVDYEYYADSAPRHSLEAKPGGTVVAERTLDYDADGQRLHDASKTMNADNHAAYLEEVHSYTYDPRDRVRAVTKAAPNGQVLETESYVHDANNNVISQTVAGKTITFTYDRNRLTTASADGTTATSTYDAFGRLDKVTSGGTLIEKYRYDGFDRVAEQQKLREGSNTERVTTQYTYDPLDRTTTRTENPGAGEKKIDFAYLGLSSEVLTEELASKLTKSYQYSPSGQRLSQTTHNDDGTTETSQYGYSPHSDVETLTDTGGDTRATYGYTAYGSNDDEAFTGIDKPDPQDPAKDVYNPYRFNAKRFDSATGDYDMGFRDYDPGRNSFLSRDNYNGALSDLNLTTDPWTGNRYAFASGNPITRVELDGHEPLPESCRGAADANCANYSYTGDSKYAPTPEAKAVRQAQEEQERQWQQVGTARMYKNGTVAIDLGEYGKLLNGLYFKDGVDLWKMAEWVDNGVPMINRMARRPDNFPYTDTDTVAAMESYCSTFGGACSEQFHESVQLEPTVQEMGIGGAISRIFGRLFRGPSAGGVADESAKIMNLGQLQSLKDAGMLRHGDAVPRAGSRVPGASDETLLRIARSPANADELIRVNRNADGSITVVQGNQRIGELLNRAGQGRIGYDVEIPLWGRWGN